MFLNSSMMQLDETLCNYVSSNDPMRKSASSTVFMKKKQLSAFYGKMYSKTTQEVKLHEKETLNFDNDSNKLLNKEEQRIKQKLHNRSFYIKNQSSNKILLNQKQNVNINFKPIILNQSTVNLATKRRKESIQKKSINNQSFFVESVKQNEKLMCRNTKSLSDYLSIKKESSQIRNQNVQVLNKCIKSTQTKFQLLQLYQKLYGEFKTKKDLQTSKSNKKVESNPQNSKPNINKRLFKTIRSHGKSSRNKLTLKL